MANPEQLEYLQDTAADWLLCTLLPNCECACA
jgi:hypothetical protein